MPTTNRSFFSQFFAAFRASHTQPTLNAKSATTTASSSISASNPTTSPTTTSTQAAAAFSTAALTSPRPRPIATTSTTAAAAAVAAAAASKGSSAAAAATFAAQQQSRAYSTSPSPSVSSGSQAYGSSTLASPTHPAAGGTSAAGALRRRGSDVSSNSSLMTRDLGIGGFREVARKGGEGWYIGGRTPAGDERFLRLGMIKKSEERLSLDRLSL